MRCAKCQRNEATTHFTPVVNGRPQRIVDLCSACTPYPRPGRIEAVYRRITPKEFARLQSDANAAKSFLARDQDEFLDDLLQALLQDNNPRNSRADQQDDERFLFIGMDWHALHFLLTGDSEMKPSVLPPSPLRFVVWGDETPWSTKAEDVRFLTVYQVRAVADALTEISAEGLRSRLSIASLNAAQIQTQPGKGRWDDQDAESIFEIYPQVVDFFRSAALQGDVILISFLSGHPG
jgi:hypothetical protein